jgi:hypothetical protein
MTTESQQNVSRGKQIINMSPVDIVKSNVQVIGLMTLLNRQLRNPTATTLFQEESLPKSTETCVEFLANYFIYDDTLDLKTSNVPNEEIGEIEQILTTLKVRYKMAVSSVFKELNQKENKTSSIQTNIGLRLHTASLIEDEILSSFNNSEALQITDFQGGIKNLFSYLDKCYEAEFSPIDAIRNPFDLNTQPAITNVEKPGLLDAKSAPVYEGFTSSSQVLNQFLEQFWILKGSDKGFTKIIAWDIESFLRYNPGPQITGSQIDILVERIWESVYNSLNINTTKFTMVNTILNRDIWLTILESKDLKQQICNQFHVSLLRNLTSYEEECLDKIVESIEESRSN